MYAAGLRRGSLRNDKSTMLQTTFNILQDSVALRSDRVAWSLCAVRKALGRGGAGGRHCAVVALELESYPADTVDDTVSIDSRRPWGLIS
jgi:hypothetical protein